MLPVIPKFSVRLERMANPVRKLRCRTPCRHCNTNSIILMCNEAINCPGIDTANRACLVFARDTSAGTAVTPSGGRPGCSLAHYVWPFTVSHPEHQDTPRRGSYKRQLLIGYLRETRVHAISFVLSLIR